MKRNAKLIITILGIGMISLLLATYTYNQSKEYIKGPRIVIESPSNGAVLQESTTIIMGMAENITSIELDGRPIFVNPQGRFREKLLLLPGYNILTLTARDRFDRKTKETLELVYKEPTQTIVASSTLY